MGGTQLNVAQFDGLMRPGPMNNLEIILNNCMISVSIIFVEFYYPLPHANTDGPNSLFFINSFTFSAPLGPSMNDPLVKIAYRRLELPEFRYFVAN